MRATEFISESQVIWNTNIAHIVAQSQSLFKQGAIYKVNIQELFSKTPKKYRLDPTDPTGGQNKIGDRVNTAIQHWSDGGRMDPPIISITNGQINFLDGRHRLVAAAQLGETEVPVIIAPFDHIKLAKQVLTSLKKL